MNGNRPAALVVVAGTGTEVGKTWVAARLLEGLRSRGVRVAARKPAQSYEPGDDLAGTTDAQVLGTAAGEDPFVVCPAHRWYPVPMAPMMAAAALGRPGVTVADLLDELVWPEPAVDVGLLEPAGGVRSPIGDDGGDTVTICERVRPDLVVLVADAGLGTINSVRLAAAALAGSPLIVVLNRFDPVEEVHRRNADWLAGHDGFAVVTTGRDLLDAVVARCLR